MRDDIAMQVVNIDMTVTKLRCIYLLSEGFFARLLVEIIKERDILPKKFQIWHEIKTRYNNFYRT